MFAKKYAVITGAFLLVLIGASTSALAIEPAPAESKRLSRAKDFIADEQWTRAIEELRALQNDPKESAKDEGLYWLAHSLKHSGDSLRALATIQKLEREFPSSMWVKPANALRLEIAVQLGRNDVLWFTAAPPTPPVVAVAPTPPTSPSAPRASGRPKPAPPTPPAAHGSVPAPPAPPAVAPSPAAAPAPPSLSVWVPQSYSPDADLRIQALRHLIHTDAERAIPILKEIALEKDNPGSASRAVFVLAQSENPEARDTILQVVRTGAAQVRVAAIRELARWGGPDVSQVLVRVYSDADPGVKRQVVKSLAERSERTALMDIVKSEPDADLRSRAIVGLGQAGGAGELRVLYAKEKWQFKRPIILGLFNARAESELIQIAERERDRSLRREVLEQLRLLGTPRAKEYLQKVSQNR